jgi:hypothetical protein
MDNPTNVKEGDIIYCDIDGRAYYTKVTKIDFGIICNKLRCWGKFDQSYENKWVYANTVTIIPPSALSHLEKLVYGLD